MTQLLSWRPATLIDRHDLNVFECTSKAAKVKSAGKWTVVHEAPWELFVQSKLRQSKPPYDVPFFMLVGHDIGGLAAVAYFEELDGPAQVELHFGAVACRMRGQGGGVADELIEQTLDALTTRALDAGAEVVNVSTLVHKDNHPSQKLCRRWKLRHTGRYSDEMQQWSATLLIAGAALPSDTEGDQDTEPPRH